MKLWWSVNHIWWYSISMITSWHGNAFCITCPLLCVGNHWSPVDSWYKRLVMWSFDIFGVSLNKLLTKQSSFRHFKATCRSCDSSVMISEDAQVHHLVWYWQSLPNWISGDQYLHHKSFLQMDGFAAQQVRNAEVESFLCFSLNNWQSRP